ncbi:hypothetical protein CSX04_07343 [Burkholderia cepacia]|nr:hypothetical protein CSX04_07343 [Burkholderia cepacia]
MPDLEVAEIYYENGDIKYRYSRYLNSDAVGGLGMASLSHIARMAP